jgi:hypothetical protein
MVADTRESIAKRKSKKKAFKEMDNYRIRSWKSHTAIDPEKIFKLALIECTLEEIAFVENTSISTLEKHFKDTIGYGRAYGRMSLRRKQYEVAMDGSVPMLQWLGKHRLKQKDDQNDFVSLTDTVRLLKGLEEVNKPAQDEKEE